MKFAKAIFTIGSFIGARKAIRAMREIELDDVLGVVGLERRPGWVERVLPSVALVVASAAVGAGTALFLAPASGHDLRRKISFRASDAKERITEKAEEFKREIRNELPQS